MRSESNVNVSNDILVHLARIDQHLEAIALCLCKREGVALPLRDDGYSAFYNYLPDDEEQEDNEFVFPKKN